MSEPGFLTLQLRCVSTLGFWRLKEARQEPSPQVSEEAQLCGLPECGLLSSLNYRIFDRDLRVLSLRESGRWDAV